MLKREDSKHGEMEPKRTRLMCRRREHCVYETILMQNIFESLTQGIQWRVVPAICRQS